MSIAELQVVWTGFTGAPGYSTMHFQYGSNTPENGLLAADALDTWATSIAGYIGTAQSVQVGTDVKWFNEITGVLETITAVDPAYAAHTGASGAIGPLPTGAVSNWSTSTVADGRVIRGRTFLVPLAAAAYQSDGTLTSAAQAGLQTAGFTLMDDAADAFVVWHRPVAGAGGKAGPVTSVRVPDMAAVLRSRRD